MASADGGYESLYNSSRDRAKQGVLGIRYESTFLREYSFLRDHCQVRIDRVAQKPMWSPGMINAKHDNL